MILDDLAEVLTAAGVTVLRAGGDPATPSYRDPAGGAVYSDPKPELRLATPTGFLYARATLGYTDADGTGGEIECELFTRDGESAMTVEFLGAMPGRGYVDRVAALLRVLPVADGIVAELVRDEPHWPYRTFGALRGVCHLRVYNVPGDTGTYVAIVEELEDNPSASVTNSAEYIRTDLLTQYQPLRIVECYPARRPGGGPYTYHEVTFDRVAPTWRPLDADDLAALLPGVDLPGGA